MYVLFINGFRWWNFVILLNIVVFIYDYNLFVKRLFFCIVFDLGYGLFNFFYFILDDVFILSIGMKCW